MLVETTKVWTNKRVHEQGISASKSGFAMEIRDGRTVERDKLFQVRGEGNALVGHAIATVLCLVCLFYGGSFRNM